MHAPSPRGRAAQLTGLRKSRQTVSSREPRRSPTTRVSATSVSRLATSAHVIELTDSRSHHSRHAHREGAEAAHHAATTALQKEAAVAARTRTAPST